MAIAEVITSNPKLGIVSVSFLVTLAMTLVTKFFTDQKRMKEIKDMQKKHQERMKEHRGNLDRQREIQKEIMELSMEMMRHSFKPLIITLLPIIFIFWWLKGTFAQTAIAGTWLWWYIGSSIAFSMILRKALNVA
jgi:uncharacterized membrane protein (DUF106 family)